MIIIINIIIIIIIIIIIVFIIDFLGLNEKKEAWLRRPARYLYIFFSVPGLKLQNGKAY